MKAHPGLEKNRDLVLALHLHLEEVRLLVNVVDVLQPHALGVLADVAHHRTHVHRGHPGFYHDGESIAFDATFENRLEQF